MKNLMWRLIAKLVSRPSIANWLIAYAKTRPFHHLPYNDDPSYMERYWLIGAPNKHPKRLGLDWLIPVTIRIHYIKREDRERDMHDHPWDARTIILKGWYLEKRLNPEFESAIIAHPTNPEFQFKWRYVGDTATLGFEEYHKITHISDEPVYTLFFAWKWQGVWGFLRNGVKVPWREYLGEQADYAAIKSVALTDEAFDKFKNAMAHGVVSFGELKDSLSKVNPSLFGFQGSLEPFENSVAYVDLMDQLGGVKYRPVREPVDIPKCAWKLGDGTPEEYIDLGTSKDELSKVTNPWCDETWACENCGQSESFITVNYREGDFDLKCTECGSCNIERSASVLRTMALRIDTLQSELADKFQGYASHVSSTHGAKYQMQIGEPNVSFTDEYERNRRWVGLPSYIPLTLGGRVEPKNTWMHFEGPFPCTTPGHAHFERMLDDLKFQSMDMFQKVEYLADKMGFGNSGSKV